MFDSLKQEINEQILKLKTSMKPTYDYYKTANHIDRVNYASESLGAEIVSTHDTPLLNEIDFSWRNIFTCSWTKNPVRNLLRTDSIHAGECFGFRGSKGNVTIKLMDKVILDEVILGHITHSMSPTRRIDNAPKCFSVWALELPNKNDDAIFCDEFVYSIDADTMFQGFTIKNENCTKKAFEYIRLDFLMNHGDENTCIYRCEQKNIEVLKKI